MPLRRVSLSRLESFDEYDLHAQVFELEEESVGLKGFIAIHRQKENIPALGATRFWEYKNEDHALRDALRLSRLMSCKAAMAGLSYTGGKAVLLKREFSTITERQDFFLCTQISYNNWEDSLLQEQMWVFQMKIFLS